MTLFAYDVFFLSIVLIGKLPSVTEDPFGLKALPAFFELIDHCLLNRHACLFGFTVNRVDHAL